MMEMKMSEARELVQSPIWQAVRDIFIATGELHVYPSGDSRRLEYLDANTRREIGRWLEAIEKLPEWRKVIDGAEVRRLKEEYQGIYPDIFRYAAYFTGKKDVLPVLLKLKFPEAYRLCFC